MHDVDRIETPTELRGVTGARHGAGGRGLGTLHGVPAHALLAVLHPCEHRAAVVTDLDTLLTRHVGPHGHEVAHDSVLPRVLVTSPGAHLSAAGEVVAHGHDVGLHGVVGRVGGGSRDHDAFVEISLCAVRVVSSRGEDDGTLFAHGLVCVVAVPVAGACDGAVWPRAIVHGGEFSLRRVATLQNKTIRASPEVETDEGEPEGLVALIHLRVVTPPIVPE